MAERTPMALITGSLGSGKTTLLRRVLEESDRRVAVVMNEFGEIAMDSQVIRGENVEIVELAGGCACCALAGEFEAAVDEIIEKVSPEFIVVEATGVAEADSLTYTVEDSLPQVRLDSIVCIVDAWMNSRHPSVGYAARTQLEEADVVVINKTDLVGEEEVEEVEAQVRKHNDRAVFLRAVKCDIDPDVLFGPAVEKRGAPAQRHGDVGFESFTFTGDGPLDRGRFEKLADDLPPSVYRAKGFVRFTDGGCLFNYVAGRTDLEDFPAGKTQLVFIGPGVEEIRDELVERLRNCEV